MLQTSKHLLNLSSLQLASVQDKKQQFSLDVALIWLQAVFKLWLAEGPWLVTRTSCKHRFFTDLLLVWFICLMNWTSQNMTGRSLIFAKMLTLCPPLCLSHLFFKRCFVLIVFFHKGLSILSQHISTEAWVEPWVDNYVFLFCLSHSSLKNSLREFLQTRHKCSLGLDDELITFWWLKVTVTAGSLHILTILVNMISS